MNKVKRPHKTNKEKLFKGKFSEVKSNEDVIEAYLGRGLKVKKA